MKMPIWKELKENALWAALAAFAMLLGAEFLMRTHGAEALFLHGGTRDYALSSDAYDAYRYWTAFGSCAIGLGMGLLQILPDQRRDQWALLIHRPIRLRAIFAAKAVVGVALTLLAAGIPLIVVTASLCALGNYPGPFDARLAGPAALWLLCSLSFYFAALLVALRPAGWWGSKTLPVVSAIAGAMLCYVSFTAWIFVVLALVFVASHAVAAWGSFETRGEYRGQSRSQRFALGLTLLIGATTAAATIITTIAAWLQAAPSRVSVVGHFSYALTSTGQIVQEVSKMNSAMLEDLQGRPLPKASQDNMAQIIPTLSLLPQSTSIQYSSYGHYYSFLTQTQSATFFLDHDRGNVVAIDRVTSTRTLLATSGGVTNSEADAFRLPETTVGDVVNIAGSSDVLVVCPRSIFELNARLPGIKLFALAPPHASFVTVAQSTTLSDYEIPDDISYVAILSDGNVVCFSDSGRVLLTTQFDKKLGPASRLSVVRIGPPQKFYFFYAGSPAVSWQVVEFGSDGRIASLMSLPSLDRPYPVARVKSSLGAVYPAATFIVVDLCYRIWHTFGGQTARQATSDLEHYIYSSGTFLYSWLGGLVSAMIAIALSPRYGWRRRETIVWCAAALFLSWCGLLMILAMIPWPPRVICPHCGRKRLVTSELCEHCGAPFPPPPPDGREIFEPAEASQLLDAILTA